MQQREAVIDTAEHVLQLSSMSQFAVVLHKVLKSLLAQRCLSDKQLVHHSQLPASTVSGLLTKSKPGPGSLPLLLVVLLTAERTASSACN
jgi:hypothetical protein